MEVIYLTLRAEDRQRVIAETARISNQNESGIIRYRALAGDGSSRGSRHSFGSFTA